MPRNRLQIALQKSGRLSDATFDLLKRAGFKNGFHRDRLLAHVENLPIDLIKVRDDDIPGLIMDEVVDLGFVGENVLEEARLRRAQNNRPSNYTILKRLDYGGCRLSIATPTEMDYAGIQSLNKLRIATTYPNLLNSFLQENNIDARIVRLKGSVEVAPRVGLADAICDIVSTGITLEANGLVERDSIFKSSAVLIQSSRATLEADNRLIQRLLARITGVQQAKESKYIMLHAPKDRLDAIIDILPGVEHPTLLPLAQSEDQVAVHAVSSENLFWETMEKLKSLGASSILVVPIEKMMD